MADRILLENQKPGTPKSVWDAPATNQIEGFATQFSVDNGDRVSFKINLNVAQGNTAAYRIEIYRLGYYGGDGATLVTTLGGLTGRAQPNPVTDSRGLVDAGNWSVSASWDTPADAVSGVYLAKLVRTDNGGVNQIPFIVRDDQTAADIVLQTSDTTWQAYNGWGGRNGQVGPNLYGGFDQPANIAPDQAPSGQDRAFAVSYNRPFITRDGGGTFAGAQDYLFGADYAAVHWLEKNGYDVSYISGVDADRLGPDYLQRYQAYISVGHDEYWSGDQRANVEAARDAGVNLLFWSGNEVYWKTRWESSIVDGAAYRTLVTYKETKFNYSLQADADDYPNVDPSNQWTGTWRDLRFANAVGPDGATLIADGARPENSLTGQLFGPDGTGEFGGALDVPAAFAGLRVWRDTGVSAGGALDLAPGILGYEWDVSPNDASRPASLIKLSQTTIPWSAILTDQGNRTAPGTATHNLSLYRDDSGALVFGAGTVFWSWGLSNLHDSSPYGANIESGALQQFTINMFADMGIQPAVTDAILQSRGLVRASASGDLIAATATMNDLPATVSLGSQLTISGTAADIDNDPANADGRVAVIEVSVDDGQTWRVAQGISNWSYSWSPTAQGSYVVKARAIDDSLNILANNQLATDLVTVTAPTSFSVFAASITPAGPLYNDGQAVELGMKFSASQAGSITQLRYFRASADATDTDVRDGHLWSSTGTLLGTATFNSAPGQSGWQTATLSTPVAIQAGATYVVSYKTANNYLETVNYFTSPVSGPSGMLTAPASGAGAGGNGVYLYGSTLRFPNQTYQAANYWVDVVFTPGASPPSTPDLAAASDSGLSSTDNLTNDNTPTLTGTAVAGATVQLKEGTLVLASGTASTTGAWSITTPALADGAHVLTATATTSSGASPASAGLTVTIDTTAPAAPGAPDMTAASDDGVSSSDNTTSLATPAFTGAAQAGAVVALFSGGTQIGSATANSAGVWTITSSALTLGEHAITARATDPAGNTGPLSAALPVTIVAAPPPPPSTPDLAAGSDSGASSTDNLTNDNTPTLTGTAVAGATVQLSDGATVVGSVNADSAGAWSITTPALADGAHVLTATATTASGASAASAALTITIDTAAPAAPTVPDMTAASDNGVSTTDNTTSLATPAFTGAAQAGALVALFSDGAQVGSATANSAGVWTITSSALTLGDHAITTRATDLAGNPGPLSAALPVTIVAAPPPPPSTPDLAAGSDSGVSSTDNLTNDNTPTLTGTAVAGATVQLSDGPTVVGSANADSAGAWSITTPVLPDGAHLLTATATTANGASPASAALTITIDTAAPAAPSVPDMTAASDNGASTTDNTTSLATPAFTGAAQAGALVGLFSDGAQVGSATANGSGAWTIASAPLTLGDHAITARATDPAGNVGPLSAALPVSIVAPPTSFGVFAPSITPSGQMFNDGQAVELGMKFSASQAGSITQLRYFRASADATDTDVRDGHLWSSTGTLLGTATFNSAPGQSGWQTATLSTPVAIQAGATYVVSYKTANNYLETVNYFTSPVSGPSGMLTAPASGAGAGGNGVYLYGSTLRFPNQTYQAANYWVDVVFTPGASPPSTPDLAAASDSGLSSTDNLTNDNTPTLTGTAVAGATVQLKEGTLVLASGTASTTGAWSITTPALADGAHVLTATATTSSGASPASAGLTVTIDTTAPAAPGAPDMTAASDDGVSSSDNTTSLATPAFTGAAQAGAVVALFSGGTQIGSATANSAGVWTITSSALTLGEHAITARATDPAGNTGPLSAALPVTIVASDSATTAVVGRNALAEPLEDRGQQLDEGAAPTHPPGPETFHYLPMGEPTPISGMFLDAEQAGAADGEILHAAAALGAFASEAAEPFDGHSVPWLRHRQGDGMADTDSGPGERALAEMVVRINGLTFTAHDVLL
jgi:hypothetical protein